MRLIETWSPLVVLVQLLLAAFVPTTSGTSMPMKPQVKDMSRNSFETPGPTLYIFFLFLRIQKVSGITIIDVHFLKMKNRPTILEYQ